MSSDSSRWIDFLETAELSDVGQRRANNQDSFRVVLASSEEDWKRRGHVFVVADGMGAHAAGELASRLAADKLPHLYRKYTDLSPPEALQKAILEANAEIHRRGQANMVFHNMGTTASSLVLLPQGALVGHVGDSRVYRVHRGRIEQLTFDHSLLWELQAAGQLENAAARASIPRNVITRSLGPSPQVAADLEGPVPLEQGDVYLLCSDGLSGQLDDSEIGAIAAHLPPMLACQLLVDLANLRGGPDNITVVIARVALPIDAVESRATPLTLGADSTIPPLAWVICLIGLLFAAVLWLAEEWVIACILAVVGVGALVFAVIQTRFRGSRAVLLGGARRLGKGPYRDWDLPSDKELAEILAHEAVDRQHYGQADGWRVDWPVFQRDCDEARLAAPRDALPIYVGAFHRLMEQYRKFLDDRAGDSGIDL